MELAARNPAAHAGGEDPRDVTSITESDYSAEDITVLEGLEAIRRRPGMYIGSTGPTGLHHLVWEVVDNSVDEAMAGHCGRIDVTIHPDGSCEVEDDGRGIPVDIHADNDRPAAEVVMTMLHAGGKFGGEGYKVSGGLHGVGLSVVNALSRRVEVAIRRGGRVHRMSFADGGDLTSPLADDGPADRTGTVVRFWPDPAVFVEGVAFRFQTLLERFQMMAFLNRDLEIRSRDLREHQTETADEWAEFKYSGGIVDFVRHLNQSKESLFDEVGHYTGSETINEIAHSVEVAFQWNTGFNADGLHSFANGIATIEGGMHEQGFRAALTSSVNAYARSRGLLKEKDANLQGEDIREGLTAIVSVRISEPQFEGQTKSKLGNASMRSLVQRVTHEKLTEWMEEHPAEAGLMAAKAVQAARARAAAVDARRAVQAKSLFDGAGMPDKLKDCASGDPARRELFIVEGDSAGGSAVRARDPATQAILPIRGKILNVERARMDKMLKNTEIKSLITAIGAGFGNQSDSEETGFDPDSVRYHKVIVLADADVDGSHIRTLLLTFFYRQMRPLVERGYVYIAQPPLYSTRVSAKETAYLADDAAKDEFLAARPNYTRDFQRLKGLGEMDWEELRATTMDASTRSLLQVSVEQAALADDIIGILMGDDVEQRRGFIVKHAREVRNLDF